MDKDDRKKLKTQALVGARAKTIPGKSHSKEYVTITDKEWDAIQNGAISENKLKLILTNSKSDRGLGTAAFKGWQRTGIWQDTESGILEGGKLGDGGPGRRGVRAEWPVCGKCHLVAKRPAQAPGWGRSQISGAGRERLFW